MKGLYLIPDRQNIEESLQLAKDVQASWEYNDFFMPAILEDKKKQLEIIAEYAKIKSDFSKDTMHGAFFDVTIHSSDAKIREISELRVRQSMEIAKEMGLRGVVFHTNRLQNFRTEFYLKNWVDMNEVFFRRICEEYSDQQIFMENMFDEAPDVLAGLAKRMKDVNNFGICLDYAHGVVSGTATQDWMRELSPYTKHMHINDNDLKNDLHEAVGSAQISWNDFVEQMRAYQIDATILVEVSGVEKQKKSLEYMKKHQMFSLV